MKSNSNPTFKVGVLVAEWSKVLDVPSIHGAVGREFKSPHAQVSCQTY